MSLIFKKSSALVTGGTGFLGRRLVERLLGQGRDVIVLARRPADDLAARGVRFICTDLADAEAVCAACAGVETVFHTAAKVGVWGRYKKYFQANVLGTRALLEGCREHGVKNFIYTSTPSVVYTGRDLVDADESLQYTADCPAAYPLTKAIAEHEVLAANSPELHTVALRPHLIWGAGDPHLVPRLLASARAGRLRIVGQGKNRVDLTHVENAVDAHLLAESNLAWPDSSAAGHAYFITDGAPVMLWDWINGLLRALNEPPITKKISLCSARVLGAACEFAWSGLPLRGEPPMTRFVAAELAKDHWFNITAARRDLGYTPRVNMAEGMAELVTLLTQRRENQ
ncbi:MAG TPA: NAD-dependent epimerase/dehydratase family protein [Opitutaceae bacterium]|nr:NAD-dependent epimerase/dehydratase family protein [Opitutaceae bacterium]